MATTGLEVFDKTLHTTNRWLDEISAEIGPDRHLAWHVLGSVLRSIRDEMQVEQSAHFAAQLPLIIRGAYYDQYRPAAQPAEHRTQDDFIARIRRDLDGARPIRPEQAIAAVMRTLNRHVTEGQVKKVRDALPKGVRSMWPEPEHKAEHAESSEGGAPSAGQHSELQHAAPPSSAPQPAAPKPAAQRAAAPQPHAPQQHAIPQHERTMQVEEIIEEAVEADDDEETLGKHVPIGTASRPAPARAAQVYAAPPSERTETARKTTKMPSKRKGS
jgi:uncharacterized protein (DUF2267 family)